MLGLKLTRVSKMGPGRLNKYDPGIPKHSGVNHQIGFIESYNPSQITINLWQCDDLWDVLPVYMCE